MLVAMNLSQENGNPSTPPVSGLTVVIPCFNAGSRIRPVAEGAVLRGGFRLAHAPVRTVYEPGNPSSHFRKVADSARIYLRLARVLLRRR